MKFFRVSGFVLISTLFLLCIKVERKPSSLAEKGGILRIGMLKEPLNLNPLFPSLAEPNPFYDLIFQPLFRIEKEKVIPVLAESWEFSEDLKSITFYLRKGVKWHDGKEFTSEDVVFTYNMIKDPEMNSPLKAQLRFIKSVVPLGKYKVKYNFSGVYLYELFDCNLYPLPSHILKGNKDMSKFSENPVGLGPYKVKNWIKGNLLELESNENYFLFTPLVKTIYFKFYDSPKTVALAYEQGRIDIALDLTPEEILYLKEKNLTFNAVTGNRVFFIGFNLEKFPYNELNFRKAISSLINKDELISRAVGGYAEKTFSPLPPHHWAYDPSLKDVPFNPDEAEKLLSSLGFENRDRDPYLELNRKKFTMKILTENEPFKKKVAEIIKEYIEKSGIRCEVDSVPALDFVRRLRDKDFDVYLFSWSMSEKVDLIPLWHSKYGIFNFTGFKNSELDRYLENSILTINQEKSKQNFSMSQKILLEKLPSIYLFVNKNLVAFSDRVKGLDQYLASPISNLDLAWVPKNMQEIAVDFELKTEEEKPEEEIKEEKPAKPVEKPATPPPAAEEILRKELAKKTEEVLPAPVEEETPPPSKKEVTEAPPLEEKKEEVKAEETPPPSKPKPREPQLVAQAKILKMARPVYPEEAKKLNLRGMAIVRVLVNKNGRVVKAEILKSSKFPILDESALEAAKQFVFEPVKDEEGEPVEFFTNIPFRFP